MEKNLDTNVSREQKLPRHAPVTDIIEREDGFHILLDMPGVSKDDLAIDLNQSEVMVSGAARHGEQFATEGGRTYHHVEFGGSQYRRSFTLSDSVDRDNITAQLKDGVLDLFLPKSQAAQPKRIEINAD